MDHSEVPSWKDNREAFGFVTLDEWRWLRHKHAGRQDLHVVIMAGIGHAAEIVEELADADAQRAAGLPVRVRVKAVVSEDPRDRRTANRINASKRIYRFLGEEQEDGSIQGEGIDAYMADGLERCKAAGVPVAFTDPRTPEGWAWLMDKCYNGDKAPFNMVLGNPWGGWVPAEMRKLAGEISLPDPKLPRLRSNKMQLRLQKSDTFLTHGLCFGFHPNLECGSDCGLGLMAGNTPIDYFLDNKEEAIRLSLMAYGPGRMDNPDLWLADGPVGRIAERYPSGRMRPADIQRIGYEMVKLTQALTRTTLMATLPLQIARRAHVLGSYHINNGGCDLG